METTIRAWISDPGAKKLLQILTISFESISLTVSSGRLTSDKKAIDELTLGATGLSIKEDSAITESGNRSDLNLAIWQVCHKFSTSSATRERDNDANLSSVSSESFRFAHPP